MGLWQKIVGAKSVYRITVDFSVPVEEMVRRGKYQYVQFVSADTAFTTANYPPARRGVAHLELHLLSCQRVSILDALNSLDPRRFQPAALHELLVFGALHPRVQMRTTVVAPGNQVQAYPGDVSVPCLGLGGLGRLLNLQSITHDMNGYEWKLAAISL